MRAIAILLLTGCASAGACPGLSGCGRACTGTDTCNLGLHCTDGRCTAECSPSVPCAAGSMCNADGTCVAEVDAGRDGGPTLDAPPSDNTCAQVRVDAFRTTPNVLLVIDRSGSMNLQFDATGTRWTVLRDSLLGTDGLVTTLAPSVRFGGALYSEDLKVAGCPDMSTLPASIDNRAGVMALFAGGPGGNTPTGQAMQYVLARIDTLAPERTDPTVMVLCTDGEPATCEDGTDVTTGRMLSVEAASAAWDMGIRTYVISVGTEIATEHLQDVANAGAGHGPTDADAEYWVATDTTGLQTALSTIVSGVLSCTLELDGRIDPTRACQGRVTLGTSVLNCGTEWRALDENHIEVLGDACTRLQHSTDVLFGTFPCDVILI